MQLQLIKFLLETKTNRQRRSARHVSCEIFNILLPCSPVLRFPVPDPSTSNHHKHKFNYSTLGQHLWGCQRILGGGAWRVSDINAIPATVNHISISKAIAKIMFDSCFFWHFIFIYSLFEERPSALNLQFNRLPLKIYK